MKRNVVPYIPDILTSPINCRIQSYVTRESFESRVRKKAVFSFEGIAVPGNVQIKCQLGRSNNEFNQNLLSSSHSLLTFD